MIKVIIQQANSFENDTKADYGFDMMLDDMTIAIWLTIPPERMQELCPGEYQKPKHEAKN